MFMVSLSAAERHEQDIWTQKDEINYETKEWNIHILKNDIYENKGP
jgi:hypothetical protein